MSEFDADFMARLEALALAARRIDRGLLRADRLTRMYGQGVQFAEHRPYAPGDDLRHLDWNAYARFDSLVMKRFEEEQDLHLYVLLDISASMDSGEPNKLRFGKRVAAALSYIALAGLDRAGITLVAEDVQDEFPVTRGRGRFPQMLDYLAQVQACSGTTNLMQSAERFLMRPRRQGVVALVSDLYDPHGFTTALDCLRVSPHEVHVVQVTAPGERSPETLGDVDLVDAETGARREVTITERARDLYRRTFERFLGEVEQYCRHHEIPLAQVATDAEFEPLVIQFFRRRGLLQ